MKQSLILVFLLFYIWCSPPGGTEEDIEKVDTNPDIVLDRECEMRETNCSDGIDNDCDGKIDYEDKDCSSCSPEICNGLDDDCDGEIDEGENLCNLPNAVSHCERGRCVIDSCLEGYVDRDKIAENGCEQICEPISDKDDTCDNIDDDCDGEIDEDWEPKESCGVGACERMEECIDGVVVCTPREPLSEDDSNCNGIDDNCNGEIDEGNWDQYEVNNTAPGYWLGDVSDKDIVFCDASLWPEDDVDFFYFYNDDPMFENFRLEIYLLHLPADYNIDLFACDDNESSPTPACNNWIYQESSTNPGLEDEYIDHHGTPGVNDGRRYMIKVYPAEGVIPVCDVYCIRIIGT